MSSRSIAALLDRLDDGAVEAHSIMIVRRGHVIAEGWWAPYSSDRPHLLYSLTKSFTATAVGLAIADGLLSLDDRVVDVLPDHVPAGIADQGRRLTVHHLLSMTAGHPDDSLAEAWQLEPDDLTKGFLRVPFAWPEGTRHTYDNATTYVLARMVERVTGRGLPEFLDERLFRPLGIDHAEWDRVAGGAAFGFHGLHLTTEAVAAFGELLLRGGRWADRQLLPADWLKLATSRRVETFQFEDGSRPVDSQCGYGYQFWMARHGYRGDGAFGQLCLVYPEHDLVVVTTAGDGPDGTTTAAVHDCLLPGVGASDGVAVDDRLAARLGRLAFPLVSGTADPERSAVVLVDGSAPDAPLPDGTAIEVEPAAGGWLVGLGPALRVEVGYGEWRESSPLGRPLVAAGAWQGNRFVAELFVITSAHRVRLEADAAAGTATATWSTVPLTSPDLTLHLRAPLLTRPDVG